MIAGIILTGLIGGLGAAVNAYRSELVDNLQPLLKIFVMRQTSLLIEGPISKKFFYAPIQKISLLALALGILAFGIGCSEQKSTTENDFAEDIVGEPIIEITESFLHQTKIIQLSIHRRK